MGLFSSRGMDRGTHTEAHLIAERTRSTGREQHDDDYESWGH